MQALIIADDLTGALDSAATLVAPGRRVVVARRPADVAAALERGPDVLAISTASREGSAAAARAAVAAAIAAVDAGGGAPSIVLKKIDSRLKGHVRDEVAALAALVGRRRALVAPAVPTLGRIVVAGQVTGAGVAQPIDVATTVAGAIGTPLIPDTRSDAELDAALAAALDGDDRDPPLLVGAAGLAAAIARRLGRSTPLPPEPLTRPILFAIGSHDPITLAQVDRLAAAGLPATLAPDGACPSPAGDGRSELLRLVPSAGAAFDPAVAGPRFARSVAARLAGRHAGTLLACGGETADAVLGALGVGVLRLDGEILPGVPVSTMLVGGRPMQLVTKSGGFGGPDALVSVLDAAGPPPGVGGQASLEGAT